MCKIGLALPYMELFIRNAFPLGRKRLFQIALAHLDHYCQRDVNLTGGHFLDRPATEAAIYLAGQRGTSMLS